MPERKRWIIPLITRVGGFFGGSPWKGEEDEQIPNPDQILEPGKTEKTEILIGQNKKPLEKP